MTRRKSPNADFAEPWIRYQLECLLWIEIAKRKTRLDQPELWEQALALRNKVQRFLADLAEENDDLLEGGPCWVLDIAQLGATSSSVTEKQWPRIKEALHAFESEINALVAQLTYLEGFRLSDFTTTTDLVALYSWWNHINSSKVRAEFRSEGRYSPISEVVEQPASEELIFDGETEPTIRKGEMIKTVTTVTCPVSMPIPVHRPPNLTSYSTPEDSIVINDAPLAHHVVLALDLDRPLPPLMDLVNALKSRYVEAHESRFFRDIHQDSETIHYPLKWDTWSNLSRCSTPPMESHQFKLFLEQRSPGQFIEALTCWDAYTDGGQRSKMEACRSAMALLDKKYANPEQSLKGVIGRLNDDECGPGERPTCAQFIRFYDPTQLPWRGPEEKLEPSLICLPRD